jgi:hypothetical protein
MIGWSKVFPEELEKFCAELLERSEFTNVKWFGSGGGDKGHDLLTTWLGEPLRKAHHLKAGFVQCKR